MIIMGKWEELDIEVNVNYDDTAINETILKIEELHEIFNPLGDMLNDFKKDVENEIKNGTKEIAEQTKSIQEQIISMNGSVASGQLLNSIEIEQTSEFNYIIGTSITDFYPLTIENGRDDVYPVNAKYLHFVAKDGTEVFTKHSRATKPKPFVEPTFIRIQNEAISILEGSVSNVTN